MIRITSNKDSQDAELRLDSPASPPHASASTQPAAAPPTSVPNNSLATTDTSVLSTLQEISKQLNSDRKSKDSWDKFGAISTFASTVVIAVLGLYFTHTQTLRQNKLTELDLLVKFMPYLTGQEEEPKKLAITTMCRLGSPDLAASVAEANPSIGALAGMLAIRETPGLSSKDKDRATLASQNILARFPATTVLFATNRSRDEETKSSYGTKRDQLSFGAGLISIPPTHEAGTIELPSLWRAANEDQHIMLRSVDAYEENRLFSNLNESLAASNSKEITVYVHGYNVSFESALQRTAQLSHDLQLDSPFVLFSWPSNGRLMSYTADEQAADFASADFSRFLQMLKTHTQAKQINIVSHGLGCRLVLNSLTEMSTSARSNPSQNLLEQLILVAPDVDREIFAKAYAPAVIGLATRVTLYASDNDAALKAAGAVHSSPRLGDSSHGPLQVSGVDTIVVESETFDSGAAYFAASNTFLLDLQQVLQDTPTATRSTLRRIGIGTLWVLHH